MPTLVERLRTGSSRLVSTEINALLCEAADTIDRLTRERDAKDQQFTEFAERTADDTLTRIAELEAELATANHQVNKTDLQLASLQSQLTLTLSQRDRAVEALKPFANVADMFDDIPGVYRCNDDVEVWQKTAVGDLRKARAAIEALAKE